MKEYIYKVVIDEQVEKRTRSTVDIKGPLSLIKLVAFKEYQSGNFKSFLAIKETYSNGELLDIEKWIVEK